uniref:Uncharacterized protein n=1 Tax=Knipowitschia caucasica TaxID=637954 RepID=A0AAV2KMA2_KNICA
MSYHAQAQSVRGVSGASPRPGSPCTSTPAPSRRPLEICIRPELFSPPSSSLCTFHTDPNLVLRQAEGSSLNTRQRRNLRSAFDNRTRECGPNSFQHICTDRAVVLPQHICTDRAVVLPQHICTDRAVVLPQYICTNRAVVLPQHICTNRAVVLPQYICTNRAVVLPQHICTNRAVVLPQHICTNRAVVLPQYICTNRAVVLPQHICTDRAVVLLQHICTDRGSHQMCQVFLECRGHS